jgi:hypothetical protein
MVAWDGFLGIRAIRKNGHWWLNWTTGTREEADGMAIRNREGALRIGRASV